MAWKHNMKHELQGSQGKAVVANFKETYKWQGRITTHNLREGGAV
jgi:hypothetical protein